MEKMSVQAGNAPGQLACKDKRLTKSPDPARGEIALQIKQPYSTDMSIRGPAPYLQPRAHHAQRPAMQIFRKIEHGRANLGMHRMSPAVGRQPKGNDKDVQAATLQRQDFLGDERLR